MKKFFQIEERGSTIKKEILAGLVTFVAMIYILPTNVNVLSGAGMNPAAVFAATAIASAFCTLLMGLWGKYPIALSAGMGMNTFFTFTVCNALGYTWQEALTITLIAGILFLIATITPVRKWIIEAIPNSLKSAVIVGLGAFIAFVGLSNMQLIVADAGTKVALGDLSSPSVLLGVFGILVFLALHNVKWKIRNFSIAIALGITTLVGYILGVCGVDGMPVFSSGNSVTAIQDTFGQAFFHFDVLGKAQTYALLFAFIFVNIFDTTATLLSVGKGAGVLNEKGDLINGNAALLADAAGAVVSGVLGTSPVTSFAESNTGIDMGGRTGLTAVTVGILFTVSIFAYPVFSVFTHSAITGIALVAIGAMMFGHLEEIDWKDPIIVFTSFIMVLFMILCYSISDGLGIGVICYCIMMLAAQRGKEVNWVLYSIAGLFVLNYIVNILIL